MAKKKNKKNQKKPRELVEKLSIFSLPEETKKWILGVVVFIVAIIVALSFFDRAGVAGSAIISVLLLLFWLWEDWFFSTQNTKNLWVL